MSVPPAVFPGCVERAEQAGAALTLAASLHDLTIANRYCDTVAVMEQGRFVAEQHRYSSHSVPAAVPIR